MFEAKNDSVKFTDNQKNNDFSATLEDLHTLSTGNFRNLSDHQLQSLNATVDSLFGTPEIVFGNGNQNNSNGDAAQQGHAIADQLQGNMQATAGDIAAARAAYGNVSGISLTAASARGALDSAINSATYRLEARNAASGTGDNLEWVQANFANADAYRAWKREVTSTVGNSTVGEKRPA